MSSLNENCDAGMNSVIISALCENGALEHIELPEYAEADQLIVKTMSSVVDFNKRYSYLLSGHGKLSRLPPSILATISLLADDCLFNFRFIDLLAKDRSGRKSIDTRSGRKVAFAYVERRLQYIWSHAHS